MNSEGLRGEKTKSDLRSERTQGCQYNDHFGERNAYDTEESIRVDLQW